MTRGLILLKKLRWIAMFAIVGACVDPIHFDSQPPGQIIVLEGFITAEPGPYIIKMSQGLRLESDSTTNAPITGAAIVLHNDKGETESFTEVKPGEYSTGGAIQGSLGGTYHITMTMQDGATFESAPETILPSGEVKDIHFQYEARTIQKSYGPQPADVFNIFVDATALPSEGQTSFVRWRFTGTYVLETNPEQHLRWLQGSTYFLDPWPCSGWEVDPAVGGGKLVQRNECTCCRCWITQHETIPRLSDNELVEGGEFRNLKVGEAPISRATFYEAYRVTIEQMTISKNAFDFFKIIRTQKEGATNLFQPPPGKITGNIMPVNANYQIIGLFWAAAINRKSIYIHDTDVPYQMPSDIIPFPCNSAFANSTSVKPADWDEHE